MILKILYGSEYVLFDNLRRVAFTRGIQLGARWEPERGYLRYDPEPPGEDNEKPPDWRKFSPTYAFCDTTGGHAFEANMVRALDKRGNPLTFVFSEGFILSDEGKTIEVIRMADQ